MSPEQELRHLILGAQREGHRLLAAALAPTGLTPAQAEVLAVLSAERPLALADLGQRLICEAGSPSRLVDGLVEAGLVERTTSRADRRRVELAPTAEGLRRAYAAREIERIVEQRIAELPLNHVRTAIAVLRILLQDTSAERALDLRKAAERR